MLDSVEYIPSVHDEVINALGKYVNTDTPTKEQAAAGFISFPDTKFYPKQEFAIEHCKKFKIGGHDGG